MALQSGSFSTQTLRKLTSMATLQGMGKEWWGFFSSFAQNHCSNCLVSLRLSQKPIFDTRLFYRVLGRWSDLSFVCLFLALWEHIF